MKVKDIGKAIGEFELNNIPKLIKTIALSMLYWFASLIIKYWYIYFALFTWLFINSSKLMAWEKYNSSYINIGSIGISEEGFYTIGLVIGGYIIARKIAKTLALAFDH